MSPQGKVTSTLTVSFIGHAAEAGVYSYIGLSLYSNIAGWWSWSFIILQCLLIIIGRYAAIYSSFYFFKLFFKSNTINASELAFIGWGGMIRGAIAFALVMKIPKIGEHSCTGLDVDCYNDENYSLVTTSCLAVVFITTIGFGTSMSYMGKILAPPKS